MQGHIQLLQHVNASVFVFADVSGSIQKDINSPLSKRPQLENHEWPEYCKKISDISSRLNDVGLPMSYHEHMGTFIQTEKDVDRFINETNDNTYLLYDT